MLSAECRGQTDTIKDYALWLPVFRFVFGSQQMFLFMRLKKFLIDLISNAINAEQYVIAGRYVNIHTRPDNSSTSIGDLKSTVICFSWSFAYWFVAFDIAVFEKLLIMCSTLEFTMYSSFDGLLLMNGPIDWRGLCDSGMNLGIRWPDNRFPPFINGLAFGGFHLEFLLTRCKQPSAFAAQR